MRKPSPVNPAEKVLRRSMIEKYSSKNIDDKKLISTKSNLIYWSECWLFNVLQLTNIEIYLYSTIYEMNNFDVELDSYLSRSHVVRWISRNETLRESFSKTFVLRSLAHFVIRSLKIWAWSLNRWVRLIEDLAEIIEQALLDLKETMRWLDVTYSYSRRRRNMILFLKTIVSIIRQWIHWIWKTFLYWISFSSELLAWFFEFFLIVNLLIQSSEVKTSLRVRIRDEKTSWRSRLSFTIVNVFFHARNHASFMREMLVSRTIHREDDHFDRFKIQIEFFVWFFLKFIENDRLSWMKNAVNSKWWMRKWIVKKTKMRCKKVLRFKRRFLFLRFWSNFSFASFFNFATLSVDFFCLLKKRFFLKLSWCRLCEIFFRLISTLSNLIDRCRNFSRSFSRRIRDRSAVKNVLNFLSRILFSSASLTWVVSSAIVANVSMLSAWLYECRQSVDDVSMINYCRLILRFMLSRDKFSSRSRLSSSSLRMTLVASRECVRCCFFENWWSSESANVRTRRKIFSSFDVNSIDSRISWKFLKISFAEW
jgi:hypothetical protein